MDQLRAMRLFVLVARSGSLSAAGRQSGLSPASVSRHINDLEISLGARLLNRSSRSMTLTEAGRVYVEQAEQIIRQVTAATDSILNLDKLPRGTIRVHSRLFIGSAYILPLIPEFMRTYPETKITLLLSNEEMDVANDNIDVDIRLGKLRDSALAMRKLAKARRILCAAPAYLKGRPPVARPGDLTQHNCLTYSLNFGQPVWSMKSPQGVQSDIAVAGTYQTDYGPSLRFMALEAMGIVLMPEWSVRQDIAEGRLVQLLPDHEVSHVGFDDGIYAVFQKTPQIPLRVRLFVDFLVEAFRREPF